MRKRTSKFTETTAQPSLNNEWDLVPKAADTKQSECHCSKLTDSSGYRSNASHGALTDKN